MDLSSKLSFYDFLAMFLTGVIISVAVFPYDLFFGSSSSFCCKMASQVNWGPVFFFILCYLVGLIWHKLLESILGISSLERFGKFLSNCFRSFKRNNPNLISSEYENVYKRTNCAENNSNEDSRLNDYYMAYYKLMFSKNLGNIPILEAQEAFVRDIILPLIIIGISYYTKCISNVFNHFFNGNCFWFGAMPIIMAIILFFVHYPLQKKIYHLVWEGEKYFDRIDAGTTKISDANNNCSGPQNP